jgi:hypothetical protein
MPGTVLQPLAGFDKDVPTIEKPVMLELVQLQFNNAVQ